MDISFLRCPNCKCELVVEQKVIGVNGLEGEAFDDAMEALELINTGVEKWGPTASYDGLDRSELVAEHCGNP